MEGDIIVGDELLTKEQSSNALEKMRQETEQAAPGRGTQAHLNNELHAQASLPGLNIVGHDSTGHLLIADNKQGNDHRVYQVDENGKVTNIYTVDRSTGEKVFRRIDTSQAGAPEEPVGPEGPVALEEPVGPEEPVAPEEPVGPEGPVAPVEPVAPGEPVVPEVPVAPEEPVAPVGPVAPEEPVGPVGPVGPEEPVAPVGPVGPEVPVAPVGPVGPEVPVGPEGPVAPEEPVGPEVPVGPVEPVAPEKPAGPEAGSGGDNYDQHQGTTDDIGAWVKSSFADIDRDNNGYLTAEEIDSYRKAHGFLGDNSLTADRQLYLQKLSAKAPEIEELSNDEFLDENNGITRDDLDKYEKQENPAKVAAAAAERQRHLQEMNKWIQMEFARIDSSGNGWLSPEELRKYRDDHGSLGNKSLTAEQEVYLQELLDNAGTIEEMANDELGDENDGITAKDLQQWTQREAPSVAGADQPNPARDQFSLEMSKWAVDNFARFDADNNGFLTSEEICAYVRAHGIDGDRTLTEGQQIYLMDLYNQVGEVQELENDEWLDENSGITIHDLLKRDR